MRVNLSKILRNAKKLEAKVLHMKQAVTSDTLFISYKMMRDSGQLGIKINKDVYLTRDRPVSVAK